MRTPEPTLDAPRAKRHLRALKLDVGALKVETFELYAEEAPRGTVMGLEDVSAFDDVCVMTVMGGSCFTCRFTCYCPTAMCANRS